MRKKITVKKVMQELGIDDIDDFNFYRGSSYNFDIDDMVYIRLIHEDIIQVLDIELNLIHEYFINDIEMNNVV